VLQPKNLKSPEFIDELRSLEADLQIVVAFRMLPEAVWNMPPLGTYNLHGSLLPKYRGAAPIHWAVINGEAVTGVTSFKLKHEIDTGDIAYQSTLSIGPDDTTGDVHDKMMVLGADTILKTVKAIEQNVIQFSKQDDTQVTKAPKIYRETCLINFDQTNQKVHDFIRGLSPFPGAYTSLDGIETKIMRARKNDDLVADCPTGSYVTDNKSFLSIKCNNGFIDVLEIKMAGKRQMPIEQLLNGFTFGKK
jgi:methionyl-tRNA formyltransferase